MQTTLEVLREYIRESGAAVLAFLSGLAFLLLTLLRDAVEARYGWILPAEITAGGGIALMILGQFQAYSRLRQRFPLGIDKRLTIIYQWPEKEHLTEDDRRNIELGLLKPMPDEAYAILFGVKETIPASSVELRFDGPIYGAFAYWRPPAGEPILSEGEPGATTYQVKLPIPRKPLVAGTVFQVRLNVNGPVELKRASVVMPPAAPPPTKFGS